MEKHDDEAKTGKARPELEQETDDLSVSLTGSSVEIDEKRHQTEHEQQPGASEDRKVRPTSEGLHDETASAYSSDSSHSTGRGEADLANEEIEESVPGRDLDRELSRVGLSHLILPQSMQTRWLPHGKAKCGADEQTSASFRSAISRAYGGSSRAAASSPRSRASSLPSQAAAATRKAAASGMTRCRRLTSMRAS